MAKKKFGEEMEMLSMRVPKSLCRRIELRASELRRCTGQPTGKSDVVRKILHENLPQLRTPADALGDMEFI